MATIPNGVKIIIDGGSWRSNTTGGSIEQKNNAVIAGTMTNVDVEITDDDYTIASGDTINMVGGSLSFNDLNVAGTLTTSNNCDVEGDTIETTGTAILDCGECVGDDWEVTNLEINERSTIDSLETDTLDLNAPLIVDNLTADTVNLAGTDTFLTAKSAIDCDSITGDGYLATGVGVDTSEISIGDNIVETTYGAGITDVDCVDQATGSVINVTRGAEKPYLIERKVGDDWVVVDNNYNSASYNTPNNGGEYRVFDGENFRVVVSSCVPRINGINAPIVVYAQVKNPDTDYLVKRSEITGCYLTTYRKTNGSWNVILYNNVDIGVDCVSNEQTAFDINALPNVYNFRYDFNETLAAGELKAVFRMTRSGASDITFECLFGNV